MIRVGDHELILYPHAEVYRLFNLAKDPTELKDLATIGEPHTQKAKDLFKQFLELQAQMNAPLDVTSIYPQLLEN